MRPPAALASTALSILICGVASAPQASSRKSGWSNVDEIIPLPRVAASGVKQQACLDDFRQQIEGHGSEVTHHVGQPVAWRQICSGGTARLSFGIDSGSFLTLGAASDIAACPTVNSGLGLNPSG